MSIARAVAVGLSLCVLPAAASADTAKAWTAAKAGLPTTTAVVVGFDVATLTKSTLFKMAFPMLLSQKPELKAGLELVKTTCKIDVLTTVDGMVAGMDKDQKQGALYLQVKGVDEKALLACLDAIAKTKGAKMKVTTDGVITELAVDTDKIFLTWISKDVIALGLESGDKTQLATWTGGKKAFAKSPAAPLAAKVDTKAAIWAASTVERDVDGIKMKGGYGGLTSAKANLAFDLHLLLPSAADAKKVAEKASAELATKINGPGLAPALKPVLESVSIKDAGTEVVVKANVAEGQVLSIVGALMNGP